MIGPRAYLLPVLAALSLLAACEKEGGAGTADTVPVQLALSVGPKVESLTRGNPAVITEMSASVTFRGMTGVTILPFNVKRAIEANDLSIFSPSRMSDISQTLYTHAVRDGGDYVDGIVENIGAHLYPTGEVSFPSGTASALAYGYAPLAPAADDIRSRHLNGALNASGLGTQSNLRYAGDIHFDPVPILAQGLPDEAQALANLLNAIFVPEVRYQTSFWYDDGTWHEETFSLPWDEDIEDTTLRECLQETLNGGKPTPGAGRSVEYIISRLYRRLKTRTVQNTTPVEFTRGGMVYTAMKEEGGSAPLTWGELYNGLTNVITARIEALNGGALSISNTYEVTIANASRRNYPGSLGLPDGAAILRWNGTRFYPVEATADDSAEGIAPVSDYCYPPRLWYFANSTLSTSSSDKSSFYSSSRAQWTDVLGEYRYGKTVSGSTEAVALDQPLQFSCGMLVATVSAADGELDDGDGDASTTVPVRSTTFPVTGIIIGSQQQLNFDFTPTGGKSYSLYDDCISGVYAKPVAQDAADSFRTFVSQTPAGENVYICLELRNDSGQTFVGADGIVLPGSKFYLVGNIMLGDGEACVFLKDHVTTINCKIASLAEARNTIPNLEQSQIALGIVVSVDWVMSTPGHVILS